MAPVLRSGLFIFFSFLSFAASSVASESAFAQELEFTTQERQWLSTHPSVSLAFDGYFPPYSFLNDNNELEGIAVDVFKLLETRLGILFDVYPEKNWSSIYQAGQNREVDLIATMVERPERKQWFNFTKPYIAKSLVVITSSDNQTIQRRDDLTSARVALVKDYQYVSRIIEEYPSIQPLYTDNMLDALHAVSTGKADAAITYLGAGHFLRTKYLLSNLKYAAVYDKNTAAESIAVRSDWPELVSILNKALQSIPEQTFLQLREKWLPQNYQDLMVEIDLSEEELTWIESHPQIRLGIDPEFAPFEFMDGNIYSGMAADYIRLLNQRLNINLQIIPNLTWDEVIALAEIGEIDVLPAIGKTAAREQYLNFTKPYLQFHRVIITRSNAPMILGIGDLKNLAVGVQANSSHQGYLAENTDIQPRTFETLEASLLALSGGKVDALVGNVASSTYWIRKLNLNNLKIAAPVSQEIQSLHFAVRKDWPELHSILQKGLDSISDRQRQEISEKWLRIEYGPVVNYNFFWQGAVIFSLAIVLVVLWNASLNRKVKQRSKEVLHYAYYDPLTKLPNRFLIEEKLNQLIVHAQRDKYKLAMLSIDLDNFKKINESFGHESGDQVLIKVANRLQNALSEVCHLGRLGGDQFLALVPELDDVADAALTAKALLKSLEGGILINTHIITFTATIGIAVYPNDGKSSDTLLRNADSATNYSKAKNSNSYSFFTAELHQIAARKLAIEEQMRYAMQRQEFYLVYQPKFSVRKRKVIGFEALVRWNNQSLGRVAPEEFIPIAENSGLIEPLGLFVLRTALNYLNIIRNILGPTIHMAVNLSPRQFKTKNILPHIQSALKESGIEPQSLELEITEGVFMNDNKNITKTLDDIQAMGIKLALDDFGTGYSSLSYLRRYNFNTLKIDREFIEDIDKKKDSLKLVSAAIAMAHNLDMQVVAEGVKTKAQYEALCQTDCDATQGWLFSKPLLITDIERWAQSEEELMY